MTGKKTFFWLAIIVFSALVLRIFLLFSFDFLTFDEIVSLSAAEKSFSRMWYYLRWEMHPPLHFYYLHFWVKFFGNSAIVVKLSSVFLSLISIISFYFLGKEVFGSKKAGLTAGFVLAISPLLAFYGVWGRMYVMLFLFSCLSFYFFLKIMKAQNKAKTLDSVFYLLATTAVLYTHITALLVIFVQAVYFLILVFGRKPFFKLTAKKFLLPFILSFVLYAPWFFHFVFLKIKTLDYSAWYFYDQPNALLFFYNPLRFLISNKELFVNNAGLFLLIALLVLALVDIKKSDKFGELKINFSFSSGLLFSCLVFFISFLCLAVSGLYVLRYYIVPAIGFFLLLGRALSKNYGSRKINIALSVGLLLLIIPSFFLIRADLARYSWKEAVRFVEENEKQGDKIITSFYSGLLPLRHYYQGGLLSNAVIDKELDEGDLLLTVFKTNYYQTTNESNVDQLYELTEGAGRIFFIFSDNNFFSPEVVKEWFLKNGWTKERRFGRPGGIGVEVLIKNK